MTFGKRCVEERVAAGAPNSHDHDANRSLIGPDADALVTGAALRLLPVHQVQY